LESDTSGIISAVYQGVGLGIIAGISLHTLKTIEKSLEHNNRRKKKNININPYNYWIGRK